MCQNYRFLAQKMLFWGAFGRLLGHFWGLLGPFGDFFRSTAIFWPPRSLLNSSWAPWGAPGDPWVDFWWIWGGFGFHFRLLGMILDRFGVDVGPILNALGTIPFEQILNFHRRRCCCPSPAATPLDSTLAASKNKCLDPPGCGGLREAISIRRPTD